MGALLTAETERQIHWPEPTCDLQEHGKRPLHCVTATEFAQSSKPPPWFFVLVLCVLHARGGVWRRGGVLSCCKDASHPWAMHYYGS